MSKPELSESGQILGINRRTYNAPGWRPVEIIVVLVSGAIGDYAAYISAGSDSEWCKHNGDKISFAEAKVHFPVGLEEGRYRV